MFLTFCSEPIYLLSPEKKSWLEGFLSYQSIDARSALFPPLTIVHVRDIFSLHLTEWIQFAVYCPVR